MIKELKREIETRRKEHYTGQRWWSFAHHSTTFGAGILSLSVAAIAPLNWQPSFGRKDTVIVVLSLMSGILSVLAARGGFERKWIANRLSRSRLDVLALDLGDPHVNATQVKETLKQIVADHDVAIVTASQLSGLSNARSKRAAKS